MVFVQQVDHWLREAYGFCSSLDRDDLLTHPSGWELLPCQPCWFPVAQTPPQCLLGDIHIPATIKILSLTVPYILQFLPAALHSYTYISLVTLETAKLDKSHAFPLRTLEGCGGQSVGRPGRRCAGMWLAYGC